MTWFQDASAGANPVRSSWRFDSLGRLLHLAEPDSVLRKNMYTDWGDLIEVVTAEQGIGDGGTDRRVIKRYEALRRLVHSEERNNGLTDSATARYYLYDAPVNVAQQVAATNVLGRLARATSPTGTVTFSYDDLGRVNARVFTDNPGRPVRGEDCRAGRSDAGTGAGPSNGGGFACYISEDDRSRWSETAKRAAVAKSTTDG